MARSPRHFKYGLEHERDDTPAMRLGRAVHAATLEPDSFPVLYGVWDGARRGAQWNAFALACDEAGLEVLTRAEYDTCLAIRDAVRSDPVAGPYLQAALETEKTLEWTDSGTSLRCKSRVDALGAWYVADLKTTRDAGPVEFPKTAARLMYAHQLAFYCNGAEAVYGSGFDAVLIAVESEAPHDVCTYLVSEDDLWAARDEVARLLARVKECLTTDTWPGRFTQPQTLTLPPWAFEPDDSEFELTGLKMKEKS
jgi:exodeoxyribonuclease VIII